MGITKADLIPWWGGDQTDVISFEGGASKSSTTTGSPFSKTVVSSGCLKDPGSSPKWATICWVSTWPSANWKSKIVPQSAFVVRMASLYTRCNRWCSSTEVFNSRLMRVNAVNCSTRRRRSTSVCEASEDLSIATESWLATVIANWISLCVKNSTCLLARIISPRPRSRMMIGTSRADLIWRAWMSSSYIDAISVSSSVLVVR